MGPQPAGKVSRRVSPAAHRTVLGSAVTPVPGELRLVTGMDNLTQLACTLLSCVTALLVAYMGTMHRE